MRVLWVCNTMLPLIAEHFHTIGSNKEGWLTGLGLSLLEASGELGVTLAVAYPVETGLFGSGREGDCFGERIPVSGEVLTAYSFPEDLKHPEILTGELEASQRNAFQRIREDFRPDLIHCFGTEYPHTLIVAKYSEMPGRVLIGIQGICSEIARSYMANLPEEVRRSGSFRDRLKRDTLAQQQEKFRLRGEREKEAIALADHCLGRTRFDQSYALQCNPGVKYHFLGETLRPEFYRGEWKREGANAHEIFLSQGDYPIKGLHYALPALALLKDEFPDVRLKVAGNSLVTHRTLKEKIKISGYGRYLREWMQKLGVEDRITHLGRLTAAQMKEEYLSAGAFLCCSTEENSPNSLGEAMLLGVPCVAADVGGIPSMFESGVDGLLYKGWRPEKEALGEEEIRAQAGRIAAALAAIWRDPEQTDVYRRNAGEHAGNFFSRENNLGELMGIYREVLG